jgi:hypothetical protein
MGKSEPKVIDAVLAGKHLPDEVSPRWFGVHYGHGSDHVSVVHHI